MREDRNVSSALMKFQGSFMTLVLRSRVKRLTGTRATSVTVGKFTADVMATLQEDYNFTLASPRFKEKLKLLRSLPCNFNENMFKNVSGLHRI